MKIIVHADDCGVSAAPVARLISMHSHGRLDRVGVVPNGPGLAEVAEQLRISPGLEVAAHLNLVEGKPVGRPQDIPLLVNAGHCFRLDFLSLWLLHATAVRRRRLIEVQVEHELQEQIRRVRELFGLQKVAVDSHRHVHLIPFVMKILIRRANDWHIGMIRLVDEPLLLARGKRALLHSTLRLNLLKAVVLKALSRKSKSLLQRSGIPAPDKFLGVLDSGSMSTRSVSRTLKHLRRAHAPSASVVEIAAHPLRLLPSELERWTGNRSRDGFYCSSARDSEAEMLADPCFVEAVREAEAIGLESARATGRTPTGNSFGPRRRPRTWIEYWDSESIFSTIMRKTTDFFFERSRALMDWQANDVVLDIGCGPGYLERRLLGTVRELHGVDTSSRAITRCRNQFAGTPSFHFHTLDTERFTDLSCLGQTKVTKIVCLSVVQYYREEAELELLIESIRSRAAPGATLLIADIPVRPNAMLDAFELFRAALSHRLLSQAIRFIVKSRLTPYHAVRASSGLRSYPMGTLRRIISSLELDARTIREPLTFNRRRVHLLVRLNQRRGTP